MLEAEFHLIGLENNNIDESKWKTLLSEYKLMNNHKQNDLDKKFKKLEQFTQSQSSLKFIKIEDNTQETDLNLNLESLQQQLNQLDFDICAEELRTDSYQQTKQNIKKSIQLMQQHIYDDKIILNILSKQELNALDRLYQIQNQNNYVQLQTSKGNNYIQSQEIQMQSQLNSLKTNHNNVKNLVQKESKTYNYLNQLELDEQNNLKQTDQNIQKLDFELELKRLAKLDSQLLLLEIQSIQILAQLFIGVHTDHNIIHNLNQDYWINEGRQLVDSRLNKEDQFEIFELKSSDLLQQEFSLQFFLKQLASFYDFCGQNVNQIIDTLNLIFKYETIYQETLQTRYSDVIFKISSLQVQLYQYEQQVEEFQKNQNKNLSYDQFATILSMEENPSSLNLMQKIQNNNDKYRSQEAQRVIWRFLQFLTNGLYRWVNIILNFNKVIELNNVDLISQCNKLIDQQHRGVNEIFTNDEQRHEQIIKILNKSLSNLNQHFPYGDQLDQIFVYLKNDFIFYNWGSLPELETLLSTKIYKFNQLTLNSDPNFYTQLLQSLPNFVSNICIQLSDQAFINFQHHFLNLLNRFIDFFKAIKSLPTTITLRSRQRYNTMRKTSDMDKQKSQPDGLFGEDLNFRKQINKKRFLKHNPTKMEEDSNELEYNNNNWIKTRTEIFQSQDFEAIQQEQLRIMKEQAKKAEKPYEAKSKVMKDREYQMKELVKLNNLIASTATMNKRSILDKFQFQSTKRKNQNVISRYQMQRTNKTVSSKLSQTKTLPSLKTATPMNKRRIDKNEKVPSYLMPDRVQEILTSRDNKESFLTTTVQRSPLYSSFK